MLDQALEKINVYFQSQKNVLAVYLYGSFADGTETKLSDIDFGIALVEPVSESRAFNLKMKYMREISDLIRKDIKFDYVDAVILNVSPPLLVQQAIAGKLIFARDDDARARFEVKALKEYEDTMHLREIQNYYLIKRIKAGQFGVKPSLKG